MPILTGRFYWVLLAFFVVIAFCSTSVFLLHRPYSGSIRKSTGEHIDRMHLTDAVNGSQVTIPSKRITFVFYYNFASPQNLQDVSYASYLVNTSHPSDVDFVVITGGHIPDLEEMRRTGALPFPLIVDSSFSLARLLTVPQDLDRSFVVGQDGTLLFAPANEAFSPEDIRELFERFTTGHITYGPKPPAANDLVGQTFPNLRVREIHSRAKSSVFDVASPGQSDYLIFTATCPACMLESTLRRFRSEFQSLGIVPIVTSRVPEVELRRMVDDAHISSPIYIAEDEISGFESIYFDSGALEASVLRVHTSRSGTITKVEPLQ